MTDFTEYAQSFTPVEIMQILVTRDLYWQHPERGYLIPELNNISFRWKRTYKPELLLRKVHALLTRWCERNGTSITQMTEEAYKRYHIYPSGLIEAIEGLAPFVIPKAVFKGREKAPKKAPDKNKAPKHKARKKAHRSRKRSHP